MTKLAHTSEVAIVMAFIVMNLEKILRRIISFLFFAWRWLLAGYYNTREAAVWTTNTRTWAKATAA